MNFSQKEQRAVYMRRYRAKIANKRKKIREQRDLNESRRKLAEIRRRAVVSALDEEAIKGQGLGNTSGGDHHVELNMELDPTTCEHSSSDSSDIVDTERGPLKLTDTDILVKNLRSWFNRHSPSHCCVSDLLKILKLWFVQLPVHSRTLLGTKTDLELEKLAGGDYIHISVQHALPLALKQALVSPEQLLSSTLKLQLNIDGVPIFGSSNYSVWPILAKVVEPVTTKVFAVGMFGGNKKPQPFNEYLQGIVNELSSINAAGGIFLDITNSRMPITVHNIVCDAAARCSVRNVRSFNFRYGCDRCKVRGEMIDHRMTFRDMDAELRLDTDFDKLFDSDDEEEYRTDNCILRDAGIGMVTQFPYDYMHLICLGVVRNTATMLHTGRSKGRLTGAVISEICEHMAECAARIPKEFQRRCRTLFESTRWKATECRQFLLYSGPVVLSNTGVPRKQYENFLYLSAAIRCLCSKTLIETYMDFVQGALRYFVDKFSEIYGRERVVYNVHSLNHLAYDAMRYGVLDNFSCFEYESFLGVVKELTHKRKPSHIVQQICRRLSERDFLIKYSSEYQDAKPSGVPMKEHSNGPLIAGTEQYVQYREMNWNGQVISLKEGDNCFMLDGDVCIVRNILKSSAQSTNVTLLYAIFAVQADYFSLPITRGPDFTGNPLHSGDIGIFKVGNLVQDDMQQSKIKKFKSVVKCVLLPTNDAGVFVAMTMLHNM